MNKRSASVLILSSGLALLSLGCEKDAPPPPLPPSTSAAAVVEAPTLTMNPDDDVVAAEASAAATKKTGGGSKSPSLAKCCAALKQNAANAPAPTNTYLMTAAGICDGAAAAGQDKGAIIGALQGALKTANMPAACL